MTAVLEYVVGSLGWSLLGFAVGWIAASLRRDVLTIKEAIVDEEQQFPHGPSVTTATRWLGVIVILLAVASVIQGVVTQRRLSDVTECQAEFNAEFAEVLTLRADLAEEDRVALQSMLIGIYRVREDDAAQEERFREYVEQIQASNEEREDHPLPELPRGDCR